MNKIIPYGRQTIDDDDIAAVVEVLKSDFLTQGPKIQEFELAFAKYVGAAHAVAVNNGTSALHLACLALDLKPGDKVISTPISFVATTNSILYCGAEVLFCDIDSTTALIELNKLEEVIKREKSVKGLILVDFAGAPYQMDDFRALANKYGLWIVEDACHAVGATFLDRNKSQIKVGNCEYADLTVFSFHPVKHIATGEGGMVTSKRADLYEKLIKLRTHGITKDPKELKKNDGGWYYEMQDLGYNFRITDFQAALGISQLKKAEKGITKRRSIATKYNNAFKSNSNITLMTSNFMDGHAFHLYVIKVKNRKGLYDFLKEKGILTQVHYIPIHLQPYYKNLGYKENDFPNAELYYNQCLSLPMYAGLLDAEQDYVIEKVLEFFK